MKTDKDKFTLIYQDCRKIRFLKNYKTGMQNVVLSQPGQEIVVTASQKAHLLKFRNGTVPMFKIKPEYEQVKTEGGTTDGTR